jgi:BatD DUF11 like domain
MRIRQQAQWRPARSRVGVGILPLLLLLLLLLPLLLLVAGTALAQTAPPAAALQPLVQHQTQGAAQLTATVDRPTLAPAERCKMTLSLDVPPGGRVTFPTVSAQLGDLAVIRQHSPDPITLSANRRRWQQEYILEARHLGTQTIPPVTVSWQEGDAAAQQLTTEPLTITVASVVPAGTEISGLQDITPPVALAQRGAPLWLWWLAGAVAGGGLLSAGLWWLVRRRRPQHLVVPPEPAHRLALAALQRLQRDDLIGQQRCEEFYVRLSAIVRHYVEWRFGVRAPEQTTEEFLATVLHTGGLVASHRDLLSVFLQQCDLVKFARYQPSADDMQQAFASAKDFVEHTADAQVLVSPSLTGTAAL